MGRLIDANDLHSKIFEYGCHKSKMHPIDVMKMIEEQPTAYDVEKVVAEFEKEIEWAETHGTSVEFRKGRISGLKTAIRVANDIVKRGGVDD